MECGKANSSGWPFSALAARLSPAGGGRVFVPVRKIRLKCYNFLDRLRPLPV